MSADGDFIRTCNRIEPGLGSLWYEAQVEGEAEQEAYEVAAERLTPEQQAAVQEAEADRDRTLWGY